MSAASIVRVRGLCGVILAAGESRRMGTQKPLLAWPPGAVESTLLSSVIAAFGPFAEAILVVAGKNAQRLAPVVEAGGAMLIVNPQPELGQFSSIRTGLREVLARGFNAAMICPVDSPPLSEASMQKLAERFCGGGKAGVAPRNGEKRGHPLLATRELIDVFLSAPADSNAKMVKDAYGEGIEYVDVGDAFVGLNINTPAEYVALCGLVRGE